MRKIKLIIPIVLLFMVIGFATITTSLSINADMELLGDLDNFAIYYSRAVVNGQVDPSIIVSSTELDLVGKEELIPVSKTDSNLMQNRYCRRRY